MCPLADSWPVPSSGTGNFTPRYLSPPPQQSATAVLHCQENGSASPVIATATFFCRERMVTTICSSTAWKIQPIMSDRSTRADAVSPGLGLRPSEGPPKNVDGVGSLHETHATRPGTSSEHWRLQYRPGFMTWYQLPEGCALHRYTYSSAHSLQVLCTCLIQRQLAIYIQQQVTACAVVHIAEGSWWQKGVRLQLCIFFRACECFAGATSGVTWFCARVTQPATRRNHLR
jgi:hypothetical protein